MAIALAHPGVYVEEVPSGVRTIPSVSTSVTAFIGRTAFGPTEDPTLVSSFSELERKFGGLAPDAPLAFAARDFFMNGGSAALIVRAFNAAEDAEPIAAFTLGSGVSAPKLVASSAGGWGRRLRLKLQAAEDSSEEVAGSLGVAESALFDLVVTLFAEEPTTDLPTTLEVVDVEVFKNVTFVSSPRRVDRILASQSRYVRIDGALPSAAPTVTSAGLIARAASETGLDSNPLGEADYTRSITALELSAAEFNLLVIPPETPTGDVPANTHIAAAAACQRRRALYIMDPAVSAPLTLPAIAGSAQRNVAIFYPRAIGPDPTANGLPRELPIGGLVAGVIARTDAERGVWKAPAGLDAGLNGVSGPVKHLTDSEVGQLNRNGVNCIRTFPNAGTVIWGARTMRGADVLADEYKYLPVRRLALHIEESLYRGLQWAVFEPNDEPLWAQVRLNVGSFMNVLFRQGAFQGQSAREAYFVKCDKETTPQEDVNRGVVNVHVGFAPLKPAEFVVVKLQQIAGQLGV